MAEKLGLGNEVRELKIGQSFTNPKSTAFHTVKYDFKPASVDTSKKAAVDVAGNNQVTVTVPHLDGAGVPQTVFKGSQRPYQKECVLIIDRVTGEITLEKLSYNIQVKKTRSEYNKLHLSQHDRLSSSQSSTGSGSGARSQTPPVVPSSTPQRVSNKTRVTTSGRNRNASGIPHLSAPAKQSPLRGSPSHHHKSPSRRSDVLSQPTTQSSLASSQPSSQLSANNETHSQSALASLPLIGIDDFTEPLPTQPYHQQHHGNMQHHHSAPQHQVSDSENHVGTISSSSSSSSDSDSDSDDGGRGGGGGSKFSGSAAKTNGYSNGAPPPVNKIDTHLLNDDLCLSESGSDSD